MTGQDAVAVSVANLTKRYSRSAERPAVDGVSLDVAAGEVFGLLGPNGAGKTTTVNVCTTRTTPTAGEVRVAGCDVATQPIRVRRAIGVVTQVNTLDRSCSVRDNLYFHCRFFGMARRESRQRTAELLDAFRLTPRASARPAWLSGGMSQRLQIARAVAHRPRVLFLDEPTAGLDPQGRLALWDELDKLRVDGTTIFLTTHYMEEAERLCDRVAIVDHGRVLVTGTPDELTRASGSRTVVTLTLATPGAVPADSLARLDGVQSVEALPSGLRVLTDGGQGSLARIVPAAAAGGITDVSVREPTLETAFIHLTGRALRD